MKKILFASLLLLAGNAFAHGPYGYRGGYHHHGYGWGNWIAPALVGGVIGYELYRPPVYTNPVYINPPPVVVQQPYVTTQPNCGPWTEIRNPDGTITTQRTCQ